MKTLIIETKEDIHSICLKDVHMASFVITKDGYVLKNRFGPTGKIVPTNEHKLAKRCN